MSDGASGCLAALLGVGLVAALAITAIAISNAGVERGRQMQFCMDHGGQWDDANVRCLKAADTITVQVPKS